MIIGSRLRFLREQKSLSQGDIENRTGLLRCYISRVENGHTIPSVETIEKLSRALGVRTWEFLSDADEALKYSEGQQRSTDWASRGQGARTFTRIRKAVGAMTDPDRQLLMKV